MEAIIDYSNEFSKDIVYVTDDLKEDWWILDKSKKPLSPITELTIELDSASERKFWMYQTLEFVQKSKEIIKSKIKSESIQDILAVSEKHFLSSKISHGIKLSASREKEEQWRIKRLEKFCNVLF
ncbi:hypothetical protein A1704_23470 [Chryseobacterium cucumeris]|nr:hypothetical protein [Chryseobacterium cucumeris]KYH06643.1 hypothetical protein A1704_23470 [Chryseobacterium cucumeris]